MKREQLSAVLRRHVGHSLRCVRESYTDATWSVDAVVLRCEDCGEVLIESRATVERQPTRSGGD